MTSRARIRRTFSLLLLVLLVLALLAPLAEAATSKKKKSSTRRKARPAPVVQLVWHVETLDGRVLNSQRADEAINPASVIKAATSTWAIARLGPDYRFETRFSARGSVDPSTGVLHGDLVVTGGGDLDFQVENAFLAAEGLNRMGVRKVTGAIVVDHTFWMGWEGGSEHVNQDPHQRGLTMAGRLRAGLDPHRWTPGARRAWQRVAAARGLDPAHPPRVEVLGSLGVEQDGAPGALLLAHQSNPLMDILQKFNCFSNNDIERLDATAGPPAEMSAWLTGRMEADPAAFRLQTSSGLGTNRASPRTVVRMLREMRKVAEEVGQSVERVLPVAGCAPCTVTKAYPRLATGANAGAVAAKTGTLTSTDGGIVALAGFVSTAQGELVFCVAAPHSGRYLSAARRAQEEFLLKLIAANGGPVPRACASPIADPVADVRVTTLQAVGAAAAASH